MEVPFALEASVYPFKGLCEVTCSHGDHTLNDWVDTCGSIVDCRGQSSSMAPEVKSVDKLAIDLLLTIN